MPTAIITSKIAVYGREQSQKESKAINNAAPMLPQI